MPPVTCQIKPLRPPALVFGPSASSALTTGGQIGLPEDPASIHEQAAPTGRIRRASNFMTDPVDRDRTLPGLGQDKLSDRKPDVPSPGRPSTGVALLHERPRIPRVRRGNRPRERPAPPRWRHHRGRLRSGRATPRRRNRARIAQPARPRLGPVHRSAMASINRGLVDPEHRRQASWVQAEEPREDLRGNLSLVKHPDHRRPMHTQGADLMVRQDHEGTPVVRRRPISVRRAGVQEARRSGGGHAVADDGPAEVDQVSPRRGCPIL